MTTRIKVRWATRPCIFLLLFITCACTASHPYRTQSQSDSLTPIRPGPPFWNTHSKQFIAAPSFDIPATSTATMYRFTVGQHSFTATQPTANLSPIWKDIPPGPVTLVVQPLDVDHGPTGLPTTRPFHRAAIFNGPYGYAILPYAQSAQVAINQLIHEPFVQSWSTARKPDPSYPLYRYASKTIAAVVTASARYVSQNRRRRDADQALLIGRCAADYLISVSQPKGALLEFFPPTYHNAKPTERENDHFMMMNAPAEAAQAYLNLNRATHDPKYLLAATHIADTYAKLQRPTGTWWLKVDVRTNNPLAQIDLIPSVVITFLDRLITDYRQTQCQPTLDRAIRWIRENPARTFNWAAQFEDAKLRGPYENLGKHEACEFAAYLFRRGSDSDVKLAEELLRFAEDQFVVWEHPPQIKPRSPNLDPKFWFLPCSLEQYAMFEPISGSSAFMIVAYVRAYERTHKPIFLAKAKSLANSLTVAQHHHQGRYPTRMIRQDLLHWINSTVNTAAALEMLARIEE